MCWGLSFSLLRLVLINRNCPLLLLACFSLIPLLCFFFYVLLDPCFTNKPHFSAVSSTESRTESWLSSLHFCRFITLNCSFSCLIECLVFYWVCFRFLSWVRALSTAEFWDYLVLCWFRFDLCVSSSKSSPSMGSFLVLVFSGFV